MYSVGVFCYQYIDQLSHLGDCKAMVSSVEPKHVDTSLIMGRWAYNLSKHPDQNLARFLMEGLERRFRIGFDHSQALLKKTGSNLLSASLNQDVVSSYIKEERSLGELVGPLPQEVASHISPIGVISKGMSRQNQSGRTDFGKKPAKSGPPDHFCCQNRSGRTNSGSQNWSPLPILVPQGGRFWQ